MWGCATRALSFLRRGRSPTSLGFLLSLGSQGFLEFWDEVFEEFELYEREVIQMLEYVFCYHAIRLISNLQNEGSGEIFDSRHADVPVKDVGNVGPNL